MKKTDKPRFARAQLQVDLGGAKIVPAKGGHPGAISELRVHDYSGIGAGRERHPPVYSALARVDDKVSRDVSLPTPDGPQPKIDHGLAVHTGLSEKRRQITSNQEQTLADARLPISR